jgi:hypothetical protein
LVAILAAAVALNVAVVAPTATVTIPGTVSNALLLPSVTFEPPAGAVWLRVKVHALTPLCPRLVGLQTRVDINPGATSPIVVVVELVPRVAVTVAL